LPKSLDSEMAYELNQLKRFAAKDRKPDDLDVHESVIFHTLRYCYKTYAADPTESTKQRLKEFSDPVIKFHYGRKDVYETDHIPRKKERQW